jgi:hypothetical protein
MYLAVFGGENAESTRIKASDKLNAQIRQVVK